MGDSKRKWIMPVVVVWGALAQIAPDLFQLRRDHMVGKFLVGPTVGWIVLAIVGAYVVFRLDSIAAWLSRPHAATPLKVLATPAGVNIFHVRGGASVHLTLNIVSFLPVDSYLDSLTVRLDSIVENCAADPQIISGLGVTNITAKASMTEEQAEAILGAGSITVNGSMTTSSRKSGKSTKAFTLQAIHVRDAGRLS